MKQKIKKVFQIQGGFKNEMDRNSIFFLDYHIPRSLRVILFSLNVLLTPFLKIAIFCGIKRKRTKRPQFYLSICAIFKDESLSLKEWIEYHLIVGVQHFYLYNNNSTDNYQEILLPYIEKGIVDLVNWPLHPAGQLPAYRDCFAKHKDDSQWIAYIDLDEYLCPYYNRDMKDWLKKYKKYPSVFVYWKMIGSSGNIVHDKTKLITEQYTVAWDRLSDIGKSIFNTDFDYYRMEAPDLHEIPGTVTVLGKRIKIPPVNEFKKFVYLKSNPIGLFHSKNDFSIQLNHYFSKSMQEYMENKTRRGPGTSVGENAKKLRSLNAYFSQQTNCRVPDYSIFRFMDLLKIKMRKADCIHDKLEQMGLNFDARNEY